MTFGAGTFDGLPFGAKPGGAASSFALSPSALHAIGAVTITATYTGTTSSASNPFAIVSGPASGVTSYVQVDSTHATFQITVSAVTGGTIIISDSVTGTNVNIATSTIPVTMVAPTATGGNASASVAFAAPANNGDPITGYTVASSPGGLTASGASSPLIVSGLTNGTAYTFTVHATNSNGNSAESPASNAVTPAVPVIIGIQQIGPYLSTDTLTAPGYQVASGAAGTLGSLITVDIVTITNVSNGRLAAIAVTANADGGCYGYALWQTGQTPNVYAPRELYFPPTSSTGATTGKITKLVVFPTGTAMNAPGYQLFQDIAGVYTSVGARTTTGVTAIPNVATGVAVDLTVTLGVDGSFRGIIVWDNGAGTPIYAAPDEVFIPPITAGPVTPFTFGIRSTFLHH